MPTLQQVAKPIYTSMLNCARMGRHEEARHLYYGLVSYANKSIGGIDISPEEFKKYVEIVESNPFQSKPGDSAYIQSREILQKAPKIVNDLHNQFLSEDPTYRKTHDKFVREILEHEVRADFDKLPIIAVRGLQIDPNSTFTTLQHQFNEPSSTLLGSIGQAHMGGSLVIPRINDPYIATNEEMKNRTILWSRGGVCLSLDVTKSIRYAIRAFSPEAKQGSTEGFLLVTSLLDGHVTLADHAYRELTNEETRMARSDYEVLVPQIKPEFVIGAFPINRDGTVGEFIPNVKADGAAKKQFEKSLALNPSLARMYQAGEKRENVFKIDLHTISNPAVEDFEQSLPRKDEHFYRSAVKSDRHNLTPPHKDSEFRVEGISEHLLDPLLQLEKRESK